MKNLPDDENPNLADWIEQHFYRSEYSTDFRPINVFWCCSFPYFSLDFEKVSLIFTTRCYDWCSSTGLANGIGKVAAMHNGLSHLRWLYTFCLLVFGCRWICGNLILDVLSLEECREDLERRPPMPSLAGVCSAATLLGYDWLAPPSPNAAYLSDMNRKSYYLSDPLTTNFVYKF